MWKQLVLATSVAAQAFNLWVWDGRSSSGERNVMRVWYGDGLAYVGSVIPPEVSVAFNISSPGLVNTFPLETNPDPASSAPSDITGPLYLSINTTPGAEDPVFFSSDLPEPGDELATTVSWAAYRGFLLPIHAEVGDSVPGMPYLGPTSVKDTWLVRWNFDDEPSEQSLRLVNLMTKEE